MSSRHTLKVWTQRLACLVGLICILAPGGVQALSQEELQFIYGQREWHVPGDGEDLDGPAGTVTGNLVGCGNAEKIFNFLVENLSTNANVFANEQAAGILGNLMQESGYPEPDPTADEDSSSGRGGYGIAQWTAGRRTALEQAAEDAGVDLSQNNDENLLFQLNYLLNESQSRNSLAYPGISEWEGLQRERTVRGAVIYWELNFERAGTPALLNRLVYGEEALAQFGSTGQGQGCVGGGAGGGGTGSW